MRVLLYLGVLAVSISSCSSRDSSQFNTERWKTDLSKRYLIADDLIDRQLLSGKSKIETIQLLGNPERKGNALFVYDMGSETWGFGIKGYMLNVVFRGDSVNKVTLIEWID